MNQRNIASRVAALERRHGKGGGEMYVVALPAGMDRVEALAALGLVPGPAELVVLVKQFFGATKPVLLNCCPLIR